MPTKTDRVEQGIYRAQWIGYVTIEDVFEARDNIDQLAEADGCTKFIVFIDGTETKTLPFDLRMLTKANNENALANLVLNAPYAGEVMGRMFNKFSPVQAEFFRDRDTLMQRARELLATT
ncbi:MAG: hypothetical protein AAFV98_04895 [Chloroflexota bacterium]